MGCSARGRLPSSWWMLRLLCFQALVHDAKSHGLMSLSLRVLISAMGMTVCPPCEGNVTGPGPSGCQVLAFLRKGMLAPLVGGIPGRPRAWKLGLRSFPSRGRAGPTRDPGPRQQNAPGSESFHSVPCVV